MKTIQINGKAFSQMSLGTVQLGMNYGIANNAGKPSMETAMDVLNTAVSGGITALDTAAGYGDSEKVIGHFLRGRGGKKELFITTKFNLASANLPENPSKAAVKEAVRAFLSRSLENLGVDNVDCFMLHRFSDYSSYGDAVPEVLRDLIDEKLIGCAGVSIYHPEDLDAPMKDNLIRMIQAPMSMFDHALNDSPYMAEIKQRGIALIIRSVFLQGLFFMDPDKFTDEDLIVPAAPRLRILQAMAKELNMNIAQLAIAYIRDNPGVTSLVLGADNGRQVAMNLEYFKPDAPTIPAEYRKRIDDMGSADIARIMKVLARPKPQ